MQINYNFGSWFIHLKCIGCINDVLKRVWLWNQLSVRNPASLSINTGILGKYNCNPGPSIKRNDFCTFHTVGQIL